MRRVVVAVVCGLGAREVAEGATRHAALFGCLPAIVADAMAGMIAQVPSPRRHRQERYTHEYAVNAGGGEAN